MYPRPKHKETCKKHFSCVVVLVVDITLKPYQVCWEVQLSLVNIDKLKQAKKQDKTIQKKRKEDYDNRTKVKLVEVKTEDKVSLSRKKSSVDLPFDPEPYKVSNMEGTRVTIQRGDMVKT